MLEHSNGEAIAECLEKLEVRIVRIRQIVADHGSDVKSGIGRYRQRDRGVRFTYDVTHQVALWLEHALKDDNTYRGFRSHCQASVQALQQTALHFLGDANTAQQSALAASERAGHVGQESTGLL